MQLQGILCCSCVGWPCQQSHRGAGAGSSLSGRCPGFLAFWYHQEWAVLGIGNLWCARLSFHTFFCPPQGRNQYELNFLARRSVQCRNTVSRETVEPASLRVFKTCLGTAMADLSWCYRQGLGLDHLQGPPLANIFNSHCSVIGETGNGHC